MSPHNHVEFIVLRPQPFPNALFKSLAFPVGGQLKRVETPAGPQELGNAFDGAADDLLAILAGIAEYELGLLRGDVRRMNRDSIEGQSLDRRVHIALEQRQVVDTGEAAVEFGEPHRTRRDVGSPCPIRVGSPEQGGDPRSGTDVQHGFAGRIGQALQKALRGFENGRVDDVRRQFRFRSIRGFFPAIADGRDSARKQNGHCGKEDSGQFRIHSHQIERLQ